MTAPERRDDPAGHYQSLGLNPWAQPSAIAAAFRQKARLLHPDVPGTGNTAAFIAVKQAYDVLGNAEARADYDRAARLAMLRENADEPDPDEIIPQDFRHYDLPFGREPRIPRVSLIIWCGLGAVLCVGMVEVYLHLAALPAPSNRSMLRPTAAGAPPAAAPANAPPAFNFGPKPLTLPGTPNYYVVPTVGATMLWHFDPEQNLYVSSGQLPPFTPVQALRLNRQTGMVEIRHTETTTEFVEAGRLYPGNQLAARRAYCSYNAGPGPVNGEVLAQHARGPSQVALSNRTTQPAVVKLRNAAGAVVASIYLGPQGEATLAGLPDTPLQTDFAIGELWSRACGGFAAGMRAQHIPGLNHAAALTALVIPPDSPGAGPLVDLSEAEFERE